MSTIVFVHAHPDDEGTSTAGAMVRAAREGHRVVVVYATGGEHGTVPPDLSPGETVVARRRAEAEASARVTGAARIVWLGYADSGMTGWEHNSADGAFAAADLDEAAGRIAAVLDEEDAEVVVGYDWHGNYGHPDHVQVHRAVVRALDLASRRPRYLEATTNRDKMVEMFRRAREAGMEGFDPGEISDDGNPMGTPEAELHWALELGDDVVLKRAALASHASQSDVQQILAMPDEVFPIAFGEEHYIEPGRPAGMVRGWWLEG